jgi:hypothetical protein
MLHSKLYDNPALHSSRAMVRVAGPAATHQDLGGLVEVPADLGQLVGLGRVLVLPHRVLQPRPLDRLLRHRTLPTAATTEDKKGKQGEKA